MSPPPPLPPFFPSSLLLDGVLWFAVGLTGSGGFAAIWDNRSAFHSATFDYEGLGDRFGVRVVGVGEKPFFDANSKSRSESLGLGQQA